jgi:hypothetical protein
MTEATSAFVAAFLSAAAEPDKWRQQNYARDVPTTEGKPLLTSFFMSYVVEQVRALPASVI